MATLKELRHERLRKLNELLKLGINPYPAVSNRTNSVLDILSNYDQFQNEVVVLAGRIQNIRKFGKISFVVIKDQDAKIQLFLEKDVLKSRDNNLDSSQIDYSLINLLDGGDFIEAKGLVSKTKTGEISILVESLRILTKTLRPLPTIQDGFSNKEERLRRRYVDINVNEDVKQRFIRRSKFWQNVREYLLKNNFIEINIPVLEHTTGGAEASPFITHMDSLNQDFYLRISHELPLKRLIGSGYERVFDIGPRFRNENYSDEHLPEHIAMESYMAYQNFDQAIDFYEDMLKSTIQSTWNKLEFKVKNFKINLDQKWPRISYPDILKEKFGVDVFHPDLAQMKEILANNKVILDGEINIPRAMDNLWKLIRKELAGPLWLLYEPVLISPLAKVDPKDPRLSLRFHPVFLGTEMGNGYAELNDPVDQLKRFVDQQKLRDSGDNEAQMLDIDFVEMLEYGMPPTCGWGISERIFWALEGVSAREGVPFPNLRYEIDKTTKSIYSEIFKKNG
jgi:lysyl-tRNA synthetase class 2